MAAHLAVAVVVDRAEWVGRIRQSWRTSVSAIVETGHLLVQARAALTPDEFRAMVETDLKFGIRTVQMLISISENRLLSDEANHGSLPSSWRTLYEISRLPEPAVVKAIEAGTITPDMERRDVARLRPITKPDVKEGLDVVPTYTATRNTTTDLVLGPPSNGMQFARMAILDLEQITDDDEERAEAFAAVTEWLESHRDLGQPPAAAPSSRVEDEGDYRCPSCDETCTEDDLVAVRECSREVCGTTFAAVDGRNCPDCNSPFTRLVHELGCPSCGDEGECEAVVA